MFFSPLKYPFLISLVLAVFSCVDQNGKKEKQQLLVQHVFTHGLPDSYDGSRPDLLYDFYYVYNYTKGDLQKFVSMLDTLAVDTNYRYHSHSFFRYHDDLPDTADLLAEMKEPYNAPGGDQLVYADYHKSTILDFTFSKGSTTPANEPFATEKVIPNYYSLVTFEEDKRKERYFLKDSLTGKLEEVQKSIIFPDSNYKPE